MNSVRAEFAKVEQFAAAGTKLLQHGSPDVKIAGVPMSGYLSDVETWLQSVAGDVADDDTEALKRRQQLAHEWMSTLKSYCQISVATMLSSGDADFNVSVSLDN